MKGSIHIIVQNERIKYEFVLRRNLTIIRGNSATGKTTLIDMIREYKSLGEESGVELSCEKECVVIEGNGWEKQLSDVRKTVVFVDEGNRFVSSVEFARFIQGTDNYYVLVTREGLSTLPYSVEEIYGIRSSGKYGGLKPLYHEIYQLYTDKMDIRDLTPKKVITEDSNAGHEFFASMCNEIGIECVSAAGKSNIGLELLKCKDEDVVVIADGAAFGSEIEKVLEVIGQKKQVALYLPESFEWLILVSDVLNDKEIRMMSENWGTYIESSQYFSWERFFTELLIEKSQDSYLKYNKKKLNKEYLTAVVKRKILKQVKWWKVKFSIN